MHNETPFSERRSIIVTNIDFHFTFVSLSLNHFAILTDSDSAFTDDNTLCVDCSFLHGRGFVSNQKYTLRCEFTIFVPDRTLQE